MGVEFRMKVPVFLGVTQCSLLANYQCFRNQLLGCNTSCLIHAVNRPSYSHENFSSSSFMIYCISILLCPCHYVLYYI